MSELDDVCEKLLRDAGARKVMVFSAEGELLAHVGAMGSLDEPTSDAVAALVAEVMSGTTQGGEGLARMGALSACVTLASSHAALVVVFEEATSAERVRQKMRRARELLEKSLPGESKTGDPVS